MNKAKLKSYAPQARKDFIAAVTARANLLGSSEAGGKLEVALAFVNIFYGFRTYGGLMLAMGSLPRAGEMSRSNARDDLVKWPALHSFFFMDNHSPATASKVLSPAALVSARLIRRWETGSLFSNSKNLTSLSSTRAADRPMWG